MKELASRYIAISETCETSLVTACAITVTFPESRDQACRETSVSRKMSINVIFVHLPSKVKRCQMRFDPEI